MKKIEWLFLKTENAIKTTLIGIAVWGFCLAFLFWILRPVTGYLKPSLSDSGMIVGLEYVHVTWWGLRRQTKETEIKYGDVYYENCGTWHPVEEHLYTPNVTE
jgi:hypothetical protein